MRYSLLGFLLFLANPVLANGSMELVLSTNKNGLMLYVFNGNRSRILLNKRFSLGPSSGPNEITMKITSPEGHRYPFLSKIRIGPPSNEDYNFLWLIMFIKKIYRYKRVNVTLWP